MQIKSFENFYELIGPKFRNIVQNTTRTYKKKIGKCEKCGDNNTVLEFAHYTDNNRKEIIEKLYYKHMPDPMSCIKEFKEMHLNPSKIGFVACRKCHLKYDTGQKI